MNKGAAPILPLLALTCAACRTDMQNQPKYKPLARSWFYADGRASRPVPPDTIPLDQADVDPAVATGAKDGTFLTSIPLPITADFLKRGQERYDIYCAPCHARTGYGNGMIASRGFEDPANLNGDHVRNAPPGYIYQVIVNGRRAMASYSYQIPSIRDRWAIVAYIRALELSRQAMLDDVPPEERTNLEKRR